MPAGRAAAGVSSAARAPLVPNPMSSRRLRNRQLKSEDLPPLYVIDLSLPPHRRYVRLCSDYKAKLVGLSALYDETVEFLGVSWVARILLTWGKKLLLRRMYSKEETEEIRAIARDVGIDVYLAVAYNTLLDLFSGCMSAGVMLRSSGGEEEKMVHLRGLELIVRVEYVRDGTVIARLVVIMISCLPSEEPCTYIGE